MAAAYNVLRDREDGMSRRTPSSSAGAPVVRGQSAFYGCFCIVMNLAADRALARRGAFGTGACRRRIGSAMTDRIASPDSLRRRRKTGADQQGRSTRQRIIGRLSLSDVEGLAYRNREVLDIPIGMSCLRLHNAQRLRALALLAAVVPFHLARGVAQAPAGAGAGRRHRALRGPVYLATDGPLRRHATSDEPRRRYVLKLRQLFRYQQYHPLQHVARTCQWAPRTAPLAGDRRWS
jgi:hypothetical protein